MCVCVCTYIVHVEPVSADGVEDTKQQDDLQGGVIEGDGLRGIGHEVCVQGVGDAGTHTIYSHTHTRTQRVKVSCFWQPC